MASVVLNIYEQVIRETPIAVLAVWALMYGKNVNGVIYAGKQATARKLGVDRSTLTRWIASLVHHGLATRKETGHVVLSRPSELVRRHHHGASVLHRCHLHIDQETTIQELKAQCRMKLLEQQYRQVTFRVRETNINHALDGYGPISTKSIKHKIVKSLREKVDMPTWVEMSARSIAQAVQTSPWTWNQLRRKLIAIGAIQMERQREVLDHRMTREEFIMFQQETPASYRKRNGQVVVIKPSLMSITHGKCMVKK